MKLVLKRLSGLPYARLFSFNFLRIGIVSSDKSSKHDLFVENSLLYAILIVLDVVIYWFFSVKMGKHKYKWMN